ncbi:transposase domain-containing protein [Streptomyces sp. NPDC088124]|uniref:transposase domain-containing protein n=1 Tax=Streptomyces sp. NPDC088124 TaxID=3154654 RepID=UPI003430F68B
MLAETRTVQQRLRCLPSRVGVYFVLALGLFPSLGYLRVWDKLTAGLPGREVHRPGEKALRDLRRRLGPAPMKALFEVLAGPLAQPRTPGVCYRRWRTVAFDGCSSIKVPDRERNRSWLGRPSSGWGWAGYPLVRLMVLCETGTRGLLGAVFGPTRNGEMFYAGQLMPLLSPRMLVLADRAFDANDFLDAVSKTDAMFLIRLNPRRRPAVLAVLSDGSYLTRFGALRVRVIDADITVTTSDGTRLRDHYRLATSLLDHQSDPAETLIRPYHERWEIEFAYYALRHTLLEGHVLRSADPVGLEQELWPSSPSTRPCEWRWWKRWNPSREPTPIGPASPSRWRPLAAGPSSLTPTIPPQHWEALREPSWPGFCRNGALAPASAKSNHPRPATPPPATTTNALQPARASSRSPSVSTMPRAPRPSSRRPSTTSGASLAAPAAPATDPATRPSSSCAPLQTESGNSARSRRHSDTPTSRASPPCWACGQPKGSSGE